MLGCVVSIVKILLPLAFKFPTLSFAYTFNVALPSARLVFVAVYTRLSRLDIVTFVKPPSRLYCTRLPFSFKLTVTFNGKASVVLVGDCNVTRGGITSAVRIVTLRVALQFTFHARSEALALK